MVVITIHNYVKILTNKHMGNLTAYICVVHWL